jgi:hypothetical protein
MMETASFRPSCAAPPISQGGAALPPEPVRVELREAVAVVVFDDPERRNAMTEAMGRALTKVMARLAADAAVRAVVLTGAGVAFSAGGDLAMIEDKSRAGRAEPGEAARARNQAFMRDFYRLFLSVRDLPCPSIAAIQGAAIGAGSPSHWPRPARRSARQSSVSTRKLGIHPGMGSRGRFRGWWVRTRCRPLFAVARRRRRGRADRTREPRRRATPCCRRRSLLPGDRGLCADRGAGIQARARPAQDVASTSNSTSKRSNRRSVTKGGSAEGFAQREKRPAALRGC